MSKKELNEAGLSDERSSLMNGLLRLYAMYLHGLSNDDLRKMLLGGYKTLREAYESRGVSRAKG